MNEKNQKEIRDGNEVLASRSEGSTPHGHQRTAVTVIVAIAAIAGIAIAAWLLWPSKSGKPVPAPRSVSFGEPSNPATSTAGDQKMTLTPEQLQRADLKIEVV